MKYQKFFSTTLLIIVLLVSTFFSITNISAQGNIPCTALTLNYKTISINTTESKQLTASVTPKNASDPKIAWFSNDASIATVDNTGKVIGKSIGKTTITAQTSNGIKALCSVQVLGVNATKIVVTGKTSIYKNQTCKLKISYFPQYAYQETITYRSSNNKIATVSKNGIVTGKKTGNVTITATSSSQKTASCKIKVKSLSTKKITLNYNKKTIFSGKTLQLNAKKTPSNATNSLQWSTSNFSVASVSQTGKVIAKKKGKATIMAETSNGKTASCVIIVKNNTPPKFSAKHYGTGENNFKKIIKIKVKNSGSETMKIGCNAILTNKFSNGSLNIFLCSKKGSLLSKKIIKPKKSAIVYFTLNNSTNIYTTATALFVLDLHTTENVIMVMPTR